MSHFARVGIFNSGLRMTKFGLCRLILNQILPGILFGSASRANWDKLTVIEMVQDIESVSQRDWFICHIF